MFDILLSITDYLQYLKPDVLIKAAGEYGFYLVLFIIFAETGLFFGFFLPGDSLLFVSGLFCRTVDFGFNLPVLLLGLMIAGILGNLVGYFTGYKLGRALFSKEDSIIFKKKYLTMTEEFYNKYDRMALILGRFIPIIRTFAPILAGVIRLDYKKFMVYNVAGSIAWVASITIAGFLLGEIEFVRKNIELIVVGLIIITIIPVFSTYFKAKKNMKKKGEW